MINFEIADIATADGYFSFPTFQSVEGTDSELIPLSAYYLNALRLCSFFNSNEIEIFDRLVDDINKAWFVCSQSNAEQLTGFVKKATDKLRETVRNSEKTNNGVFINRMDEPNYRAPENLDNLYAEWANNNKATVNHFNENYGNCVAIAMPLCKRLMGTSNCFFSLSGSKKDYAGNSIIQGWKITKNIAKDYNAINGLLQYIFKFKFTECHLTENTRRYTYYNSQPNLTPKTIDGRPLKRPIKFFNDYTRNHKKNNFSRHYSCCEKKIIGYMNFINKDYLKLKSGQKVVNILTSYEFRIKYEPCKMCRPALIGCYFIESPCLNLKNFIFGPFFPKWIAPNVKEDLKEPFILVN